MLLQIDFKSGRPVYLQVVDQITAAVATNVLRTGEALPCIRPLAEELRVNRNAIARAYSELESMGLIEIVPGKGRFLKEGLSIIKDVRRKMLIVEIDQAVVQAHRLLVPRDEFLNLVHERVGLFREL